MYNLPCATEEGKFTNQSSCRNRPSPFLEGAVGVGTRRGTLSPPAQAMQRARTDEFRRWPEILRGDGPVERSFGTLAERTAAERVRHAVGEVPPSGG